MVYFSIWGAFCTLGAWFAAGGKNEIWRTFRTFIEAEATIVDDPKVEGFGRVTFLLISSALAISLGDYGTGSILEEIGRGGSALRFWRAGMLVLAVCWFACLTVFNGRWSGTTLLTRQCVALADRLFGRRRSK